MENLATDLNPLISEIWLIVSIVDFSDSNSVLTHNGEFKLLELQPVKKHFSKAVVEQSTQNPIRFAY